MNLRITWFLVLAAACAGPEQVTNYAPRPPVQGFLPAVDEVKSIQLYEGSERELPILNLQGDVPLVLEFDLMTWQARPVSVYFYHADRSWQRDLLPGEYMESYFRDDLFDYSLSRNTQVQFTHFQYRFPNTSIDFRISGNYVLRVTEQGREDDVLFERPFFVTENTAIAAISLDLVLTGAQTLPAIQPHLVVTPPPDAATAVFDMNVCFIEGGRVRSPRCVDTPRMGGGSDILYYLEPEESFGSRIGDYLVDMHELSPRGDVARVDYSTSPFSVLLQPDYARFPDRAAGVLLNGQSEISMQDDYADIEGEYAEVTFRFVPPEEQPLPGSLYVIGAFNNWQVDLGAAMRWDPSEGWYESTLLIKQGAYEYRYTSPDLVVQRVLEARLHRPSQWYNGLVYYRDHVLNTDRLLAMARVMAR